jgi:hypothetical protein
MIGMIYAKIDNYRMADSFEFNSAEEFAEKSKALKLLYPGAAVHFVESSRKKWPFIVGAKTEVKQPKQAKKQNKQV